MRHLKQKLTRLAFKLHGWLGLASGLFFLFFGLTGSVLMFRTSIERYCHPELHQLTPGPHRLTADAMYRSLIRSHPNLKKLVLHDFPRDRYDSYEFMLYRNQQHLTDNYLYYVFVNPYNGRILKEGSYQNAAPFFMRWLYSLHYSLQLGVPGKLFTAVIGLVMLLSLLTGTIVYRKHLGVALRFKGLLRFESGRRAVSSLHRVVGVWALLFNAVLFFTGFWLNREEFTPAAWHLQPPHANYEVSAHIDNLLTQAGKAVPGFEPIAVNIPATAGEDILVRGHMPQTTFFLLQGKPSALIFDAVTGKLKSIALIDNQKFEKRMDWEVYQLHIGAYGGNAIRWLYVVLGLTPGLLSFTGALLWLKRTRRL